MIPLRLNEVRALALGRLEGDADVITGVKVDSRRVEPGDLFVVVSRGEAFLDDARARGAAATLVPDDAHAALADVAIVTSDNPRSEDPEAIVAEIVAGADRPVEVELDRAAAIARAVELAQPGDVVLIAGKGAEQGQEFADRTVPFDDREAAKEALT